MAMRREKVERVILYTEEDKAMIESFRETSQAHVDSVSKTPQAAFQELVDAGIYDSNGELSEKYRVA